MFRYQLIILVTFCVVTNDCLKCTYLSDSLLKTRTQLIINSKIDGIVAGDILIEQTVPKFCTKLLSETTLTSLFLYETQTVELGTELFKNYELQVFEMPKNNIRVIHEHTFINISIQSITLKHCNIESIEAEAFKDLPNLIMLNLINNKISNIKSHYFVNLISLKQFYLENNLLIKIYTHDFDFLRYKKLDFISLSNNLIDYLEQNSLSNLTVNYLFMQYNKLTIVTQSVFKDSSIDLIDISRNPLTQIYDLNLSTICKIKQIKFTPFDSFNSSNILNIQNGFNQRTVFNVFVISIVLICTAFVCCYKVYKNYHK